MNDTEYLLIYRVICIEKSKSKLRLFQRLSEFFFGHVIYIIQVTFYCWQIRGEENCYT